MKYGFLNGIDKKASKIVYGCAVEQMLNGEDCDELLSAVLERGVTVFDTARVYGKSEYSLGNWLYRQDKRNIIVQTKCCHFDDNGPRVGREQALFDIQTSLDALKVDFVDALLLHRDDERVSAEEIITFMNEIVDKGYAKTIGVSNWTAKRVKQANDYAKAKALIPFTITSPYYGLACQYDSVYLDGTNLTGADKREEREFYQNEEIAVMAYSSLANGFLSGKYKADEIDKIELAPKIKRGYLYPENIERLRRAERLAEEKGVTVAQIALSWLLCDKMDTYAIVGCRSVKSLQSSIDACVIALTEQERAWLNLE